MSKKTPRPKTVRSRIDRLFADLGEEAAAVPLARSELTSIASERSLPGWRWECDDKGNYTDLSADVEVVLGRAASEFIDQPLGIYALAPDSSQRLQVALFAPALPMEIDVEFLDAAGNCVPVRLYIVSGPVQAEAGEDETPTNTWRGYAQQLVAETKPRPVESHLSFTTPAVEPTSTETRIIRGTSTLSGHPQVAAIATVSGDDVAVNETSMVVPFQVKQINQGLLEIIDDTPGRFWSEDERRLVEQVADQLSLALENARLFQETQAALSETRTLYAITSATTRSLELEETLSGLLVQVLDAVGEQAGFISLVNPATKELELTVQYGIPDAMHKNLVENGLKGTLCDLVYRRGEAVNIPDFEDKANIPAYIPDLSKLQQIGFRAYLGVPLESKGKVLGTLCTFGTGPRPEQRTDISLMQVAGQQIGIAVENAQLFQETESRASELSVLNEMAKALSSRLDLQEVMQNIHQYTARLIDCTNFFIAYYDPQADEVTFPLATEEGEQVNYQSRRGGQGLTEYIIHNRQPVLIKNKVTQWINENLGVEPIGREALSWLGVPMMIGEQVIGVIAVQSYTQNSLFTDRHLELMTALASQGAIAIQNARLFQETELHAEELEVLNEMGRTLAASLDVHAITESLYSYTSRLMPTDSFFVALYDESTQNVELPVVYNSGERIYPPNRKIGEGLSDWVLRNKESLILNGEDISEQREKIGVKFVPLGDSRPAKSWLGVPLLYGNSTLGALVLQSTEKAYLYTDSHRNLLTAVASQSAIAIQNARLFQQTEAALSETAGLYKASAELNTAQSYQEILDVLRRYTVAGKGAHHINISYFDRPWVGKEAPEWVDVLARWTDPPDQEFMARYPLQAYPSVAQQLKGDAITIIEDVQNDPRLDDTARELYTRLFKAASAIFVPLVVGIQWVGFLNANYPEQATFQAEDLPRLMAMAGQAAVAIQNMRSVAIAEAQASEAQMRSEELALVNRVVSAMVSSADLRQVLDAVAGELVQAFNLSHASITLLNPEHSYLTTVAESSTIEGETIVGTKIPVKGNPAIEQVLRNRRPLMVTDVQTNPLLAPMQVMMHERGIQTIAFFPIIAGGEVIGTIGLDTVEKGRTLTQGDLALGETLVGQISTSIQNANLYEQTQRALAETETLYLASGELNMAQTNDDILRIIRSTTILGHDHAVSTTINLFDQPWTSQSVPEWLIPIANWTAKEGAQPPRKRFSLQSWEHVQDLLKSDSVTVVENPATDVRLDATARKMFVEQFAAQTIVFAPLFVGGQWVGDIEGIYSKSVRFDEQDLRILRTLAGQAAVSVQNLRLLAETSRRATQLETAAEIARDASGTLALDTLLNRAVNLIRERYGYYHSSLFLLDEGRKNAVVRASTGLAGEEMTRTGHKLQVGSQSMVGIVTDSGSPMVVNDVTQNPVHRPNPLLPDTQAEIVIPMKIGKRIIGALDVQADKVDAFTQDDVAVLQTLADQIAVAVDNARSYELVQQAIDETRRRVQELSVLFELSQSLAGVALASDEIANIVAQYFVRILEFPEVSVTLIDTEKGEMRFLEKLIIDKETNQPVRSEDMGIVTMVTDYPMAVKVMQTMKPLVIKQSDSAIDPLERKYLDEHSLKSQVTLPLAVKGSVLGLILLQAWDREHDLSPDQLNLAMTLANSAATALENARLYEGQRQTAEQLREVDKLKSQFLANMSHELRTPLNSIIGFSRVILKGIDGPITELQKQDLTAINSAGQHLLQLINDVLDISKIEAGKMELAFDEHINLADLITSAMSTAIGLTKDKPIKLIKEIPADLPVVRADPTRIRQVLINFLSNAAKFTEEGTITVQVEEVTSPVGLPEIMVRVIDTGPGIAKSDQERLFQPFTQVDASPTRKVGGSGLGLSISRLLVDLHGGRIGVISDVGQGSTFYFTLPLFNPDEMLPFEDDLPETPGEDRVILTIDDDRQVLNLYERYLVDHGYRVVPLLDGSQAVQAARQHRPFAITLDIMMPRIDGWQVLETLKQDPATKDIPVIICSIVENQEKGFSLGAVGYLTKPILEEDLVKALNRINADGSIQEVLVVDDDKDDLRLVQKILEDRGSFKVRLANGGIEGLVALQASPPQVVILDLFMPDLDGFSLIETMRGDPKLAQIPVIIFTAGDLTDEQHSRLAEFSQKMLYKSEFKEEELLGSLETVLKKLKAG